MKEIIIGKFLLLFLCTGVMAQRQVFEAYAEKYSAIAISEMHRTGIPASIKLAQALLESNAGRSELARKANNHFGIKCGGDWNGKTYHKEDDDYRNGRLVKSCFRVFKSVEESFVAHSEFLRNPSKYSRYNFLFSYESTDYKSWAHGLKKAGYATAPTYAQRLIKLIEDYELYKYDQAIDHVPDMPVVANLGSKGKSINNAMLPRKQKFNNGVRMVYAMHGESVSDLAERHSVDEKRIIRYNEHISSQEEELTYGDRIYFSRKRGRYRGKQSTYKMREGEELIDVAQKFGIRLRSLRYKNRLKEGQEPATGEVIYLKSRRKRSDVVKLSSSKLQRSNDRNQGTDQETVEELEINEIVIAHTEDIENPEVSDQGKGHQTYTVQAGDTLYSISRKFNLSVYELKSKNTLTDDTISIGQLLLIP